jgi:5'-3' exoribonuclease 2
LFGGICVLYYSNLLTDYLKGPSWKWYYPFHYAPFASDLRNIERFEKDVKAFDLSTPFNPVEQLMAVLPSDSSHAIPKAAMWLMMDPESPILDFYPKDVPVDPNGKAMPWLWVVLLPFIEEDRLLGALYVSFLPRVSDILYCAHALFLSFYPALFCFCC